eukprot:TRINITY_DN50946_c0_g1_i1.p1 TRINITY_DN50946_c0_g1~~TRINITY_DN50946_c0_g1_i1.p1  ORF type:complete len:332 (+),score=60.41 TRINITY_DN50946_c0_g1_i1:38-997(+)
MAKRPTPEAAQVKVAITGSDYLAKEGIQETLQAILQELACEKPSDLLQALKDGLETAKRRKLGEEASGATNGHLPPFPSPGEVEWRRVAKQRSLPAVNDPLPGIASILCNGEDRYFPVDPKDTALVLIDMQTDFLEPTGRVGQHYAPHQDLDKTVRSGLDKCEQLLKVCRQAGLTIAHSRSHRYGSIVRDDLVGTDDVGYELHPRLRALEGEIVVDKWTYGAFASTFLERELRKRGVNRILLCGVLTNVCIFATASQAVDRFIRVCLVEDACAAFDNDWHKMALQLINQPQTVKGHKRGCGLYFGEVTQVDKVEEALKK